MKEAKNNFADNLIVENEIELNHNYNAIVFIYAIVSGLWILFSDRAVTLFIKDTEQHHWAQTYKGWFFVFVTSVLLYYLIKAYSSKLRRNNISLRETNQELVAYTEEIVALDQELQDNVNVLQDTMEELSIRKSFLDEIFSNSNMAIMTWQLDGTLIDANQKLFQLTGYSKDELVNKDWSRHLLPEQERYKMHRLKEELKKKQRVENYENYLLGKDGRYINMLWNDAIIREPNQTEPVVVSFGLDITKEREIQRMVEQLSYRDQMTGLKNKETLKEEIQILIEAKEPFHVFLVGIDNFKMINDLHGYEVGNEFMATFAKSLKAIPSIHEVYRWTGDEFVVIYNGDDEATFVLELLNRTRSKWQYKSSNYELTASIGIARFPEQGHTFVTLLQKADIALNHVKNQGKSDFALFTAEMEQELQHNVTLEQEIERALQENELALFYQPIVNMDNYETIGFEVLLRWAQGGYKTSIGELIGFAEKSGQIMSIDKWVLKAILELLSRLKGYEGIYFSVNLSAQSILSIDFIDYLTYLLEVYPIDHEKIIFEITEHTLMANIDKAQVVITQLSHLGFGIALDDFGTKYSSLNYLSMLPFSTLKVDKSYIDRLADSEKNQVIFKSIMNLTKDLGLSLIVEGIETQIQKELLLGYGCAIGQGYLFSKAVPEINMMEILNSRILNLEN